MVSTSHSEIVLLRFLRGHIFATFEQMQDWLWSVYHVKKMLLRFMVKLAAEELKAVMPKSGPTQSRAGMSLSIDNRVMDRFGKLIRCTYSWYSGRYHKVIRGQDLLGIVLTINGIALPLHLLFCPKQGRYHTKKADVLIFMLKQLKAEFDREGIDITQLPLTLDSGYVSQELRVRLHQVGFSKIIIAGKGNYVFTIDGQKWDASTWKKVLMLEEPKWGIDVPSCRTRGYSPTFGSVILFFFRKTTTRSYYLMNFSQKSLRGAEIWHIWKQHVRHEVA